MGGIFRTKKGITPVIAIVLLLMMTVAAAGAVFMWITDISEQFQQRATDRLGKKLSIKSLTCYNNSDEITVFISNTGDKTIDIVPVNIIVYDYSTDKAMAGPSVSQSLTFSSSEMADNEIADFSKPGKWDKTNVTLDDTLDTGTYTIEFEFPQDNIEPRSERCKID